MTPEQLKVYDAALSRGLCSGWGDPKGQVCIEASAIAVRVLRELGSPGVLLLA
jgi:hypothetical protein